MNHEVVVLLYSTIILFCIAVFYYKRHTKFKVGLYVFSLYTFVSIMSIVFYHQPFSAILLNGEITWWPFFFWLVTFLVFCIPVYKFDYSNIVEIKYDIVTLKQIAILGVIISILPFFEQLYLIPKVVLGAGSGDFGEGLSELHDENTLDIISPISRNLLRGNIALYDLAFLMLIIFFIQPQRDKLSIYSTLFIIVTRNLTGLLTGHRSALVEVMLKLVLIALIAYPLMNRSSKIALRRLLLYVIGGFFFFFMIITIGRVNTHGAQYEDFTLVYFLSRYMGEGLINFNQYLPLMQDTTGGDFCFWPLKVLLGITPNELSHEYMYGYLATHMGIPQNVFYTFIGSFVLDIGFSGTFIWLTFVSFFFLKAIVIKNGTIALSSLFLFVFYVSIILFGPVNYLYIGDHGKFVIFSFIVYAFLRLKKM